MRSPLMFILALLVLPTAAMPSGLAETGHVRLPFQETWPCSISPPGTVFVGSPIPCALAVTGNVTVDPTCPADQCAYEVELSFRGETHLASLLVLNVFLIGESANRCWAREVGSQVACGVGDRGEVSLPPSTRQNVVSASTYFDALPAWSHIVTSLSLERSAGNGFSIHASCYNWYDESLCGD